MLTNKTVSPRVPVFALCACPAAHNRSSMCVLLNEYRKNSGQLARFWMCPAEWGWLLPTQNLDSNLEPEVMLSSAFKQCLKKTEQFRQVKWIDVKVTLAADCGAKIDYTFKTLDTIYFPFSCIYTCVHIYIYERTADFY